MVESFQTTIEGKLKAHLNISFLYVKDQSGGCGASFLVIVISDDFSAMKLLERQQKVNEILAEEISKIHAFELKTWTPAQWEQKKSEYIKEEHQQEQQQ